MVWYCGAKLCSTSIPNFPLGKSRTCPIDAFTTNFEPRILLIVWALAGDSTMTSYFAIVLLDGLTAPCFDLCNKRWLVRAVVRIALRTPASHHRQALNGPASFVRRMTARVARGDPGGWILFRFSALPLPGPGFR